MLIWAITDDPKLSEKAREILLNLDSLIFYSFANIWEIAIKHALHKPDINFFARQFEELCRLAGYLPLETSFRHAYSVETLKYADNAPRTMMNLSRIIMPHARFPSDFPIAG